jgi:hypothetical protein
MTNLKTLAKELSIAVSQRTTVPPGAFAEIVTNILRRLPENRVADFLDNFTDNAFRDYTQTTEKAIRSEHIPFAATHLINLRDMDVAAAKQLIFPIRDQFIRRSINPTTGLAVVPYFLLSDMHRDTEEKTRLLRLLAHWFSRINMHHLFYIFDPKNRLFINWVMQQGASDAFDETPRALLHYYWICVASDRSRLSSIREKMKTLLGDMPNQLSGADAECRNSLQWIATAQIQHIASTVPLAIPERKSRLRVAICVSGQMRGYEEAVPSWSSALSLDTVDFDIYLHTWSKIGRKELTPYHATRNFSPAFAEIFAREWKAKKSSFPSRYPTLFALFKAEENIDVERIRKILSPVAMAVESDEIFPDFVPNVFRMHYKIEQSYNLAIRSGKTYDIFVRLRPDKKFSDCGGIDWEKVYEEVVQNGKVFTDMAPKIKMPHGLVMGDQFHVMDPIAASTVFRAWSLPAALTQQPLGRKLAFAELGRELRQHLTLSQLVHFCGRRAERFPYPIFLPNDGLIDPQFIPASEVEKAIRNDAAGRTDDIDMRLLQAITHKE